jgi:thiol-disulfide isomerase/thioredoxin
LLFALLIIGFAMKDSMNNYVSRMMKSQVSPEINQSGLALVDSLYNYSGNGLAYKITFLEFGANCPACKRMESVMDEIRQKYPETVNVVFLNVLLPENQNLIKYFGVAAIPTQVLLDNEGKEYFRHTGTISLGELNSFFKGKGFFEKYVVYFSDILKLL